MRMGGGRGMMVVVVVVGVAGGRGLGSASFASIRPTVTAHSGAAPRSTRARNPTFFEAKRNY